VFAIGLDEIECWLLPVVFDRSEKPALTKVTGCLEALNAKLRKLNEAPLSTLGSGKDPRRYDRVSAKYRRRKQLEEAATNPGLLRFLCELGACVLDPEASAPAESGPVDR
jgi:hypothetical protein